MNREKELIEVKREERTLWLYLNREEQRNALNIDMIKRIIEVLEEAKSDPEITSLVITGKGKVFCAGADLNQMSVSSISEAPLKGLYGEMFLKLLRYPKPTVAMVNGPAVAGGVGLILGCHLAIATKDSFFSTPEITLGFFPYMVMSVLFRTVPRKIALEMILTGRRISSEEALKYGLVNRVVERERLEDETKELLSKINKVDSEAFIKGLEAVYTMEELPLEKAIPYLQNRLRDALLSEKVKENIRLFFEKRKR